MTNFIVNRDKVLVFKHILDVLRENTRSSLKQIMSLYALVTRQSLARYAHVRDTYIWAVLYIFTLIRKTLLLVTYVERNFPPNTT